MPTITFVEITVRADGSRKWVSFTQPAKQDALSVVIAERSPTQPGDAACQVRQPELD